jgi:hypothetical protein
MPRSANCWRCTTRRTRALEIADREKLFLDGFGDGRPRLFRSPAAKEKSQMPCAALAAAERPQEQEEQDGPLQEAAPVRPQNILTSAQGALPRPYPKRNGVRPGHKFGYIVTR